MGQGLIHMDVFFLQLWWLEVENQVPTCVGSGETLLGGGTDPIHRGSIVHVIVSLGPPS